MLRVAARNWKSRGYCAACRNENLLQNTNFLLPLTDESQLIRRIDIGYDVDASLRTITGNNFPDLNSLFIIVELFYGPCFGVNFYHRLLGLLADFSQPSSPSRCFHLILAPLERLEPLRVILLPVNVLISERMKLRNSARGSS